MQRKFASVESMIWTGETGREWRRLGRDHQVLGLYLITNPHADRYGLYYLPSFIAAEETGITKANVKTILQTFASQDFAYYDERTEFVWIVTMAPRQLALKKAQDPDSPSMVGARRWYQNCPPNPFLAPFFDRYGALLCLNEKREGAKWAPPVVEQSHAIVATAPTARNVAGEQFERFWTAYPKKSGKKAALAEWLKIVPLPSEAFTDLVIDVLDRLTHSAEWIKDHGQFIPDPERWLRKGKWMDEASMLPAVSNADAQRVTTLQEWAGRHDGE